MKNTISLYIPGDSWGHRLNPLTKLVFMLCMIIIGVSGKSLEYPYVLLGVLAVISLTCKLFHPFLTRMIKIVLPFIFFLFLIHGFFNSGGKTVLIQLAGVSVFKEGLYYAGLMTGKISVAVGASLLFILSTSPDDLIIALRQKGVPTSVVYVLGATLQIIPLMKRRADSISAAQQTRGLETEGTLKNRVKAFFPLLKPLILSSLVDVEERAIAIEARGFWVKGDKTSLKTLNDPNAEMLSRWLMLLITLLFIAFNYFL